MGSEHIIITDIATNAYEAEQTMTMCVCRVRHLICWEVRLWRIPGPRFLVLSEYSCYRLTEKFFLGRTTEIQRETPPLAAETIAGSGSQRLTGEREREKEY